MSQISNGESGLSARNKINVVLGACLFSQTQAVTVASTANETALTGTGVGSLTIAANLFTAGKTLKISAFGVHSATGNPSLTIKIKFGSTIILTTGAISSQNGTNNAFKIQAFITCYTTGAGGTLFAQGFYEEEGASGSPFGMVNSATASLNTTVSQTVSITAQWGTGSLSNSITMSNLLIEAVGG